VETVEGGKRGRERGKERGGKVLAFYLPAYQLKKKINNSSPTGG